MPEVYRVAPCVRNARAGTPGHPAYVPVDAQGGGRIDNSDLYATLYLSDTAAGAVAEVFARRQRWDESMFAAPARLPGSAYALMRFSLDADTVDLDDPGHLVARALRPSRVVTPDRTVTQRWAAALYLEGAWSGARWWSSLDSRWGVFGVWSHDAIYPRGRPAYLGVGHPAVREAATALDRVLG